MELDKLKLLHDHTKHVTTLATGSILVLIAFYDKLPITPIIKILVLFSLFFFIFLYFFLCILAAMLAQMIIIVSHSNHDEKYTENTFEFLDKVFFTSWITFSFGIIVLFLTGLFGFPGIK
ncbi:MAG: hypothetical protein COB30_019885 [Ectothiorhodospiraceae bacterium]|nr:hypothetical protein [Ectothiorhodospiraceae bacterium]